MKTIIVDRAIALEDGQEIVVEMESAETCKSLQVMVSNLLTKVSAKVRANIMVRRCRPGKGSYPCEKHQLVISKIDFFNNASIVMPDGEKVPLVEYDYKVKMEALAKEREDTSGNTG